ncbi:caspase family protein [Intrasporangium calvum]|uniref:Caspase family protein n=1 Tax=Intrasporangium calvum TaxID=53358 RepID=A0ABT5GLA3_9MICO|nr:caspase family protein [Intrasporangium calvum]MDC5698655.1 caspase family protein [Intrasporangium calvum]
MPSLHALLVGIDAYPEPVPPLVGCVNDVTAMAETLTTLIPADDLELRLLTNEGATRQAVVDALRTHLAAGGPDSTALFYFSGHGSQQHAPAELWTQEPDRRNETLVLADSRSPGGWDLADKELNGLLTAVAGAVSHLLVVLDCCHSGDGTRDANGSVRLRLAPEDPRTRPGSSFLPEATTDVGSTRREAPGATTRSAWATPPGANHVLLAACRAAETAKELTIAGRGRGALSAALERALRDHGSRLTYRDVHRFVTAGVLARVEDQHPQLETGDATDLDRAFLGGVLPARPAQLTLSHLPDGWSIDAGAVHGVPEPIGEDTTELAVYALGGETDGAPLAEAAVTSVLPDRSRVDVTPDLDPAFVYRAVIKTIPLKPVEVAILGESAGAEALEAAAASADSTLIQLQADPATADLVVRALPDGFAITRPGVTRPLVPVVAGHHREERTIVALERVARWLRLSSLCNPATQLPSGAVRIDVESDAGRLAADGRLEISYVDDRPPPFTVTLTNTTQQPLWCALLDLTETYGIFTDAFPAGSTCLDAGAATAVSLVGQLSDALWDEGTVMVTDHLKIVTSTLEFDPRSLEQPELDVDVATAAPVLRGGTAPTSTLDRMLGRVATRSVRPATPPSGVADWRTDDLHVVTIRPRGS